MPNKLIHQDLLFPAEPGVRAIARGLYERVANLPIVSPHGHTDPRWYALNEPFPDPARLLIVPDHYIYRMLFSQGVRLEDLGVPCLNGTPVETDGRTIWRHFAGLFTTLVSRTEAENHKLAREAFGSALDYKQAWTKELARRDRLGLKLPEPVPHPDDIVIDARTMDVKIKGPMTREEIPRYKFAAMLLDAYEEITDEKQAKLDAMQNGPEAEKLRRDVSKTLELCEGLRTHYGLRSERIKDPFVTEAEKLVGLTFEFDDAEEPQT